MGSHAARTIGLWRVRAAASGDMRGVIGPSAHEALHRALGITYRAAWFTAHRIRRALAPESFNAPLGGTVEADETHIGGKAKGKRGRGAANKTP